MPPMPRREADLARPRERKGSDQRPITRGVLRPTVIPDPDPDWHPIAKMLWDGLIDSGQSDFYQASDWAFAYSLCEDLTRYKEPQVTKDGEFYFKRSGQMLQTIYSAMERLLVTEGDRRRVRIELTEPEPQGDTPAAVVMEGYFEGLSVVPNQPEPKADPA